jgi:hypothetical protein
MQLRGRVIGWFASAAVISAPLQTRATDVEPLPPPGRTASSAGSLTYVMSPAHLARLTRDDDLLHPRALALANRFSLGAGVMMGGVALGALIVVGAATLFTQNECFTAAVPAGYDRPVSPICDSQTNHAMATAGLLMSTVLGLTGLLLLPSQTEWYDIINEWNARHPDRSLLVAPGRSGH